MSFRERKPSRSRSKYKKSKSSKKSKSKKHKRGSRSPSPKKVKNDKSRAAEVEKLESDSNVKDTQNTNVEKVESQIMEQKSTESDGSKMSTTTSGDVDTPCAGTNDAEDVAEAVNVS